MARIRSIKPEFWTSEQVAACSPLARLLFVGLWTFADDGGVHPASVRRLKMEVFPADPFDDATIAGLLAELVNAGLVREYDANGERYWFVTGWHRHQRIDKPTFRHPQPPNVTTTPTPIRRALGEDSSNSRLLLADASPTEWSGVESNGIGEELEWILLSPDGDGVKGPGDSSKHDSKKQNSKAGTVLSFTNEDAELAQEMFDGIKVIQPNARPPNLDRWANEMRLLRSDGNDRTPDNIRATLAWVRNDPFWKSNILSPAKLREKWDQLQLKRSSQNDHSTRLRGPIVGPGQSYDPNATVTGL